MREPLFAGLDVGTTSIKCVVFDRRGVERGSATAPTRWERSRGGAEIEGDELVRTAVAVVSAACSGGPGSVHALGITGMAESGVLLDHDGAVTSPVVRWDDPRAEESAPELYERIGPRQFSTRTGLPPTGRTSLAKLHWEATVGGPTGVVWLGVPEFLAHRLGARRVAERSLASRTGAYDVLADAWIPEHLDAAGLSDVQMPTLCSADEVIGHVTDGSTNLAGAAIVVAGHDHVCASVGVGTVGADGLVDSMGTGEALVRAIAAGRADPALVGRVVDAGMTMGRHVLTDRLAVSAGLGSGLILRRALRLLGIDRCPADSVERRELDEGARALRTPPVLVGDAAGPEWTITGIPTDAGPEALWRAALDSVARRADRAIAAMDTLLGPHGRVVSCGGWLRSTAVRETKAAAIGAYEWSSIAEPGAFGAATLAARAVGEPIAGTAQRTLVQAPAPRPPHAEESRP